MSRGVWVKGFWVPPAEAKRFESYPEFDGELRIDTQKADQAVHRAVKRRRALDVGAHIGVVTRFLSRHFDRVDSFEAIPDTFDYLVRNTSSLENVTAHHVAASCGEGEIFFEHVVKHAQLSHVLRPGEGQHFPDAADPASDRVEGSRSRVVGPIKAVALDKFGFDDVDFIKIDVEGHEFDVVRGLEETIRRCKPLVMVEQAGNEALYHGDEVNAASRFLESLGMRADPAFPHPKDPLFRFFD